VWALCFSPNGRRLASGNFDAAVTLWDTESGEEVLSLPTHRMIVTAIDFSPDGRRLAGVVNDGTIMIWDGTPLPE
jgi:WD40 repeat protein